MIRKICACVKKDISNMLVYKFCYLLRLCGRLFHTIFILAIIYFISCTFEKKPFFIDFDGFKVTYFLFVFSGVLFVSCFLPVLNFFLNAIQEERRLGTLEALLVTPTSFIIVMIAKYISVFVVVVVGAIPYFIVGIYVLKDSVVNPSIAAIVIIFILSFSSFLALALLLSSFVIVFERSEAITSVVEYILRIFGEIFFPLSFLPGSLKIVSYCLPVTHSLKAFRQVLFSGYTISDIAPTIAVLLIFSLVLWPLSIFVVNYSIKRVKIKGKLSCY